MPNPRDFSLPLVTSTTSRFANNLYLPSENLNWPTLFTKLIEIILHDISGCLFPGKSGKTGNYQGFSFTLKNLGILMKFY